MSDSLRPHEPQHTTVSCPPLSPRVCSSPCPLCGCCHPITSFSSCPQSFPASGSFPMSQLFTSGGQSIGTSASASVFLMNILGRFPLGLTTLISLLSKKLSKAFCSTTIRKPKFFGTQSSLGSNSHISMTTGKP